MPNSAQLKDRLLRLLVSTALRADEAVSFRLSSGEVSHVYVDCRAAISYPEVRQLLGQIVCDRIPLDGYEAVGGPELGAYPVATAVSDEWYRRTGRSLLVFVVRKQAKEHGLKKLVEGDVKPGQKALIVDDVVTKGNSLLQAIRRAREAGLEVGRAIALVDRSAPDVRSAIEAETKFEALYAIDELLKSDGPKRPARRTAGMDPPRLPR